MTYVRDIQPLQEPEDVGDLDDAGRVQISFNVIVTKRPSPTFVRELIEILVAAGVGVERVNIFATSLSSIPAQGGPFLSIRPTGGVGPIGTHNDGVGAYRRPGALILVRSPTWPPAEAMAQAAYTALIACRNQTVTPS